MAYRRANCKICGCKIYDCYEYCLDHVSPTKRKAWYDAKIAKKKEQEKCLKAK
jgi:hypothetical protein